MAGKGALLVVLVVSLVVGGVWGQAAKKKATAAASPGKGTASAVKQQPGDPKDQNLFPEDAHAKGFFAGLLGEGGGAPKSTDHIDASIRNNVKLPFKMRFGVRERKSSAFHFPALPAVYWSHHKRPFVPDVQPADDVDYDY